MEVIGKSHTLDITKEGNLVSVIVPVYQVEKYLADCIESIRSQSWSHLEIILVDDGSKDQCPRLCDAYAEKDPRIRVIHKANGGLSDARNAALDIATGDWILPVDSDDFIHPDMIKLLLQAAISNDAPMAWCDYLETAENGSIHYSEHYPEQQVLEDAVRKGSFTTNLLRWQEAEAYLYEDGTRAQRMVVAWNKLCRRSLFEGTDGQSAIRYPVGRIYEDSFTTYKLIYRAKKIVSLEIPLYFYRIREVSVMRTNENRNYMDVLIASSRRMQFYRRLGETELFRRELNMTMYYIIRVYGLNKAERHKLKRIYRYFYEKYFRNENWQTAKRIRIFSFLLSYPLYQSISATEGIYNRICRK